MGYKYSFDIHLNYYWHYTFPLSISSDDEPPVAEQMRAESSVI